MKTLKQTLPLLALALAAAACGRIEHGVRSGETATVTRSWPAAEIRQLQVYEVNGSISVEASTTSEVSLVATARGELERVVGAENQGLFETRLEGSTLHIGRRKHHKHFDIPFVWGKDEMKIDYVLKVPASLEVDTTTVNGRITTRGLEGRTEATSVNGTIDIESAGTAELQASTVNGQVRAKFTRDFQGARFKTVNGGVEAILPAAASFDADLSQVNGDFDAPFPLSIHSNPGSRRVSGEVNGGRHRLKIVTVNGDIELSRTNGV